MTDQKNKELDPNCRPTPPFFVYNRQEYEQLHELEIKINTEAKRQIGGQWKALTSEEQQPFKDMARMESSEKAKNKALPPVKPRKDYFQVRITLPTLVNIMKRFNDKQREAIMYIGLGGLLELRCTQQAHVLYPWLVDKFDTNHRSLHVHGKELTLTTRDVHLLLGIKDEGKCVEAKGPIEGFAHLCADLGVENGVIKLSFLRDYLQDTDDDGDEFKRKFVLFILGSFLCPTTMPAIVQSWVHVVRDIEGMKDYNWAKLTLDCLVEGIRNCKTKGHLKANGCLFLLALFYLDRVTPVGSHDVRHPSTPCLAYWEDAKIKQTLKLFEASGGYENQKADVKLNTVEECKGMASNDDTSMKRVATYLGEIKNLLVNNNNLLIDIKCLVSERDQKSKAQRLAEVPRDISMEFEKHGTSNAETVASSPAAIEKVDVIVLSSDMQEESKLSLSQQKRAQLPKNTARRGRPCKNNPCEVVSCINDGGRRTRLSKDRVPGPNIRSPYIPWNYGPKKSNGKKNLATKRKLVVDVDDELDLDDIRASQFLDNLNVLDRVLGVDNNPKAPPSPIYVHPQPLSNEDKLLVAYCFRNEASYSETIVTMDLHGIGVEVGKRHTICSLRPKTWIDAEIINMVVIQLTNAQRVTHPDECYTAWYLPTYISQTIVACKPYKGMFEDLSKHFCTNRYTGQIRTCEKVYVPMNDGSHWFCLKLDMVKEEVYLFDSKPGPAIPNATRKTLATELIRGLQELFQVTFGHLHHANLMEFDLINVEYPTLQSESDCHDCGLFIIKFMQGVLLPHGIFTFDDLERPRLVVDIVRDPNNSSWKEFSANFNEYTNRLLMDTLASSFYNG